MFRSICQASIGLFLLFLFIPLALAQTTMTYQGQLQDADGLIDGESVDLNFELYDHPDPAVGTLVSDDGPFTVPVENGLFQVDLNFGDVNFTTAKYLRIQVNGTWLAETQEITSVPVAQYALGAGGVHWSGVQGAPEFWRLGGNSGTTPGSDFIGTIDNSAFEVHVDGARALRIEPGNGPNVIAGSPANQVKDDAVGASVSGGATIDGNIVTDHFGTVAGGAANVAGSDDGDPTSDQWAAVGGGEDNIASAPRSTVSGGHRNTASGLNSTVGGGHNNTASASYSAVAGGNNGTAAGFYSTVGGGTNNLVEGRYGVVSGGGWIDTLDRDGTSNHVYDNYGTVGGGGNNRAGSDDGALANDTFATVSGGESNAAGSDHATVGGGRNNLATGQRSTVPGGEGAHADQYGQKAHASGSFSEPGDAQASDYVLRNTTTDGSPTELFLDGSGERINVDANRSMTYQVHVVARDVDTGSSDGWRFSGLVVNNGASVQINSPQEDWSSNFNSWTVDVQADDVNKALVIEVTGALNTDIRWVARVETVEVAGL